MIANPPFRKSNRKARKSRQRGMALVVILACVVLLTVMVMAYFSYSSLQRQISSSSANQAAADIFALGVVNTVIGDLKQEIAAGSIVTNFTAGTTSVTNYFPSTAAAAVPAIAGFTTNSGLENLVKISRYGSNFFPTSYPNVNTYAPSSRAINLSTTNASKNGRYLSAEDWNKPLLLGRKSTNSTTDDTPVSAFVPPDWILVDRAGGNPSNPSISNVRWTPDVSNTNVVVGRYAYAIYDEGGLLDANAAGYPSGMAATNAAFKSALAYADLSRTGLTSAQVDQLVNWRNNASIQGGAKAADYPAFVAGNTSGFLRAANTNLFSGKSDQIFVSRRQLMGFFQKILGGSTDAGVRNALQYFTHFSRDLNQPSFVPDPNRPKVLSQANGGNSAAGVSGIDDKINPSYPTVRVQRSFTRNDGSTAKPGDPLVNKRFALNRLTWLTSKGPSATRSQSDPDIQALIKNGIPWSYLQLGTAANIQKYFGLNWNGSQWLYNIHNGAGSGRGSIMRVGRPPSDSPDASTYVEDLNSPRDPDFFELLKSAITVGSLGKALVNDKLAVAADKGASQSDQPYNYNYDPERSVDRQIIQIGANMINQSQADNFPVQIVFDDGVGNRNALAGSTATTIAGVADLPYLYYIFSGVLQVKAPSVLPRAGKNDTPTKYGQAPGTGTAGDSGYQAGDTVALTDSGVGAIMQIPALWNPHDPASPRGVDGPREFRVVADSTTPNQISTSNYSRFFAYATSAQTTVSSGPNTFSYNGTGPNSSWYSSPSQTGAEIANTITANNSQINFTANTGSVQLFPEPTILLRAATITDSNGNSVKVGLGGTPLMSTDPAVSGMFSNGGLPNFVPNATRSPSSPYPTTTPYIGFYLAAFPWAWNYPGGTIPLSGAQSDAALSRVTGAAGGSVNACYLTYRIQCKDAFGNWMTYDTKYGKVADGGLAPGNIGTTNPRGALLPSFSGPGTEAGYWATVADPRTSRFGIHWNGIKASNGVNNAVTTGANGGLAASVNQTGQGGWLDYANGVLKTNRPDAQSGFYFMACWRNAGMPTATSGWMAWIGCNAAAYPGLAPGLLSQNNSDIYYSPSRTYGDGQGGDTQTPNYFADPDGIVRRGMGAFVPIGLSSSPSARAGDNRLPSADTTVGLPIARAFGNPPAPVSPTTTNYISGATLSQAQSRPYFLHRPFRSVAELGCVFSDTPWRNLDFFTAESGNTALLDVFCISETENPTSLVAGKVNLNTRQQPVLKAILAGAYLDPANISTSTATTSMSPDTADNVAAALTAYIKNNGPIQNLAELVGKWKSNVAISHPSVTGVSKDPLGVPFYDGKLSYIGFSGGEWDSAHHKPKVTSPPADVYSAYMGTSAFSSNANHSGTRETAAYIQRIREAPIRALAACGQTRVWNLLIDVVAQTGRYPQSAKDMDDFVVEAEQRCWVHVAIDRYTGQVIDKQIEVVRE